MSPPGSARAHLKEALKQFQELSLNHVASPAHNIFMARGLAELSEALLSFESRLSLVEKRINRDHK
jgi:hypothetical protein